jgi:hypothetical protein
MLGANKETPESSFQCTRQSLQESTDRMQGNNVEDLADRKSEKLYLSIRLNKLTHRQQKRTPYSGKKNTH